MIKNSFTLAALFAFAMMTILTSCISISWNTSGDGDTIKNLQSAMMEIIDESEKSEAKVRSEHLASIDPEVSEFAYKHFILANEIVLKHFNTQNDALAKQSDLAMFLSIYLQERKAILETTLALIPNIEFVDFNATSALAYPNGTILVSKSLAESFDIYQKGFDSVLLGIFIHELVHIRDGHAMDQWASADNRKAWATDQLKGSLADLTALIPIISVNYDIAYYRTYGAVKELPFLSEYAADLAVVILLSNEGYDSSRYIDFLSDMALSGENEHRRPNKLLHGRAQCLKNFSLAAESLSDGVDFIVVGLGESQYQTLEFTKMAEMLSLLDNPKNFSEKYLNDKELSEADKNKYFFWGRGHFFTKCAIKASFKKLKTKDGMLVVPNFDLNMFAQYL